MKKNLLILLGLLLALPSFARDFTYTYEGLTLKYTVIDESTKTCSVSIYIGDPGRCSIPEKASDGTNEYSVTTIGKSAFRACQDLTDVTIPNSVTSIGDYAFHECTSLTEVTIGNSVTTIGEAAFAECTGLTEVTIPNSVTTIGSLAFAECTGLTEVTIGNSVTTIGEDAFFECTGLTSVTIPNSVTSIGNSAFDGCSGLSEVTIGNSVTSIGSEAFSGCSRLKNVTIPNSVTSIGDRAFYNCSGLTSLTLGNSLNTIGSCAFTSCTSFMELTIPNSVTDIGFRAFYGCSALTSVTLGNSLNEISGFVFEKCPELKTLTVVDGTVPLSCTEIEWLSNITTLYMGRDINYIYGNLKFKSVKELVIGNKVTKIGTSMFADASDLATVTIGNSVTSIGESAFFNCIGLTEVTIPNSVTTIGWSAFSNCASLSSVIIGNSVTSIGARAFYNCDRLTNAEFASIESLCGIDFGDYYANPLKYAHNLYISGKEIIDLVIPESVTSIGKNTFYGCSGLTSVTIPSSVTTIGSAAFNDCTGLIKAEFASIESLCSIDFASDSANPLWNANHLYIDGEEITDLVIPESISSIGSSTFTQCSSLTTLTIGNSVTSIDHNAFAFCYGLTSVKLLNQEPITLENNVFGNWTFANAILDVPTGTLIYYALTDWGKFDKMRAEGGISKTYNDGVFKYRLLPDLDNPEAILIKGNYYGMEEASIPERFTDLSDPSNPVRYTITIVAPEIFKDCTNLKSVSFHSNSKITDIPESAFRNCSALTEVTIPETVSSIGSAAFLGCKSLKSVTIPNSVTSIGRYAFYGCDGLTSVTLGNSVPWILSTVFKDCTAIISLTVADGPGTLLFETGNNWLANVTNLYMGRNMANTSGGDLKFPAVNDLAVGNEVTEIGSSMFKGCTNLKEVALGNGLKAIGSEAFAGCALEEVVLPPSVESIEASAFADNANLATVTMGHKVVSIGDMAYNGCPVDELYITALTPPTAPNNTFSRYSGRLWVPNAKAVEDYYNAYTCWDRFDTYAMIEPEEIKIAGNQIINAAPGDTIRLTATISPENVTLPQIFWRSTNTDIATVDHNGVVVIRGVEPDIRTYAQGDDYNEGGCRIIAESLYADAPIAVVAINSELADIEDIIIGRQQSATIDYTAPYDVYNMQGVWLGRSMDAVAPGFYILRQGAKAAKVMK